MNAGGVLFGVKDYVPALEEYIEPYNADAELLPQSGQAIDGPAKKAWFEVTEPENKETVEVEFDMIHVCRRRRARFHPRLARWPMPPAGSMSIRPRCATRPTRTSGRSAT
jgi:hypothetical protein